MGRIAIIDGDVLAYHACPPRYTDKDRDENGKKIEKTFTPIEDENYLKISWRNFQLRLQKLLDTVYANEYLMAVKGPLNFRDDMYVDYKKHRKNSSSENPFVPLLRQLAVEYDIAVQADGREADDYIRMWATEARNSGDDYVICSIDKDLKCIPGLHYNMKNEVFIDVTPEYSLRFYYEQLLKGDPTDNIPGLPGIGDVKATNMLADVATEEEYQEIVVSQYIHAYGDDWKSYLLSNGKMIYLQSHYNDYFMINNWPIVKEL